MTPDPTTAPAAAARTPEQAILAACLEPQGDEETRRRLHAALTSGAFDWGALLLLAIEHRISCLVTDTLHRTQLLTLAPDRLVRFLQRTQRANHYATQIHRAHAADIASAARCSGLAIAACKGIAVESSLYGGTGAREFSDLDLLTAADDISRIEEILAGLGYKPHPNPVSPRRGAAPGQTASAWTIPTGDTLLTRVVVDVAIVWPGDDSCEPDRMRHAVGRAQQQPLPGLPGQLLPVLNTHDHLALLNAIAAGAHRAGRPPKTVLSGDRHRLLQQAGIETLEGGMG